MVFIFGFKLTQKIFLNVQPTGWIDYKPKCIQDALIDDGQMIPDKRKGEIVFLVQKDNYEVYMWKYTERTACSSASVRGFGYVKQTVNYIDTKQTSRTNGKLSYPFFTLEQGLELSNHHSYFAPTEKARVNALMGSLHKNGFMVQLVDDSSYCPFSGGGDMYVVNEVGESLVFQSSNKDAEEECSTVNADNSPTLKGTQKLVSLAIEGKKDTVNLAEKKYQLWANMTINCVERFVYYCIKNYSQQNLKDVQMLTGYGALLSGDGSLVAYKLEMKFNERIHFVTKIKPDHYNVMEASQLLDIFIEQYSKKVELL